MKNFIQLIIVLLMPFTMFAQWQQVNSNTSEDISKMVFINSNTGFFVSGNNIYKTSDAGENWTSIFIQKDFNFHSIGTTEDKIYAFAKQDETDKLIQSSDNGNTWDISAIAYSPIDVQTHNNEIYLLDANDDSKLKKLTPSGMVNLEKKGLYGIHQDEIVIVNPTYTDIYKSINNGQSWSALSSFPNNFLGNNASWSHIKSFGNTIVLMASYAASVHISSDNGETWNQIYENNIPTANIILDSGNIYGTIQCNEGNANLSCITGSSDYGQSWEIIQTGIEGNFLDYKFYFYDDSLGFAYTKNGIIYKTSNGGGLALTNKSLVKNFTFYPNPVSEKLTIEISNLKVKNINLYTLRGKKLNIRTIQQNSDFIIDVSGLASGIYLLELKTINHQKVIKKLLIK